MADSDHAACKSRPTLRRPTRRELLALGAGAFVVAAIPFVAGRSRRRLVRRSVPVMGTIADLAVVHRDPEAAQAAIDAAIAELRRVEWAMTRFNDTSDVGRVGVRATTDGVRISKETALVLEASLGWAEATDGAFDPCLGRAAAAWEVSKRTSPPSAGTLQRLAGEGLWRSLDLDTLGGDPAVRLHDERAALDLGGIAKGYAVDRAAKALREHGVEHALVNVGGDLYALGTSEDGDPWKVGIRSPNDPTKLIGKIEVCDEAVATSGDYERCFEHDGKRYHHLLDPKTASPRAARVHSVSVTAATCMTADAAATAAFGLTRGQANAAFARVAPDARIVSEA